MISIRTGIVLVCAALSGGCASSRNTELLESRLRNQQDANDQLHAQLQSAKTDLRVARQESNALRTQLTERGDRPLLPEQADTLFRTTGIRINRLLTGGLDRDQTPGDEAINVVVEPIDEDGEVLKVPGSLELRLFELTRPRDDQTIGSWRFDENTARKQWHSGLVGKGFQFRLPWQTIPNSDQLLLHARLTTTDGRQFDTTSPVRISLSNSLTRGGTRPNELFDATVKPASVRRIPDEGSVDEMGKSSSNSKPIRTSDRWTDATIPRLR